MSSMSLFVGDAHDLKQALPLLSGHPRSFDAVDLVDLNGAVSDPGPSAMVVSLAISREFDCFDVAQVLTFVGFAGRHRILPVGLPNPAILLREARRQFPDLDIDLLLEPALSQDG